MLHGTVQWVVGVLGTSGSLYTSLVLYWAVLSADFSTQVFKLGLGGDGGSGAVCLFRVAISVS